MRGVARVKELLRPFVDSKDWDFCIIWKLGDDPSRFMEWVDCCCSGGYSGEHIKHENVEEEGEGGEGEQKKGVSMCRDEHKKHPLRTLPCEVLSRFPLFMPLYPGIHGEVVMSKLSRWLLNNQGNGSGLGSSNDVFRTRVLVPVNDGLVELFSTKLKPVDQAVVDSIISSCNAFLSDLRIGLKPRPLFEPFLEQTVQGSANTGVNISFDGSSSGSNPSSETQPPLPNHLELLYKQEPPPCLLLSSKSKKDIAGRDNGFKSIKKVVKEMGKSKNIITERNRRYRINQGIYALRALVPKITKMDKAGTLSDAINYINELHEEKRKLEDELKHMNDMEYIESVAEEIMAKKPDEDPSMAADPATYQVSSELNRKQNEVNLEVHKISEREFLIRVSHENKRDGFKRVIEALNSTGLEIINVNFTRLNESVMNILNVKARKDGIEARKLRDVLFMMITSDNRRADANPVKRE